MIDFKSHVFDILTLSIMSLLFKSSSSKSGSKSGSKSSSKGHHRRNDQGWSEWEWSEDYQKEWRDRPKPNGMSV